MPDNEARLLGSEPVAEGTMAFRFARPVGFAHQAGQSAYLSLLSPAETDEQGDARMLTIASAPHEPDLVFATRMRDTAFKRVLKQARPGLLASIEGPNGEMVLHDNPARPAVLLAGGIGVTPFLAMARHAAQERLPHRIFLFYANRRPEDAAFLEELTGLERANRNFRLVATMTAPEKSARSWSGEKGRIDQAMLERHIEDLLEPIYYLAGPPAMTESMRAILEGAGLGAESMRSEDFFGY